MEKLKIVFMGTPDFAVGILDTIYQNNYEIVGVITATRQTSGSRSKSKYQCGQRICGFKKLTFITANRFKIRRFFSRIKKFKCQFTML